VPSSARLRGSRPHQKSWIRFAPLCITANVGRLSVRRFASPPTSVGSFANVGRIFRPPTSVGSLSVGSLSAALHHRQRRSDLCRDEFRAQSERTLRRLPFMAKVFGVNDYDRKRGLTEKQLAALGKNIAIVQIRINA